MKAIIITALLFSTVMTVNAQEMISERENRRPVLVDDINGERLLNIRQNISSLDDLGLNDEQHKQITTLQTKMQADLEPLNNQLSNKQVQLQILERQPAPKLKAINKNIDEQAKLLAKQMKLKAGYKQKIRTVLNKEQRERFDRSEMR